MSNEELLERVDAIVFSGDSLYNNESLSVFKKYLNRWFTESKEIEKILKENIDGEI